MEKVRIKLVTIGHLPLHLNLKRVSGWSSEVFQLVGEVENYSLRCDSDGEDWAFSDELLKEQTPKNFDADFLLAITNVPVESNWYTRRLGDNRIVFTFHQVKDILRWENIPLENAVLRVLYAGTLLYKRSGNRIPSFGETPGFTHDETRGCLFDMNGIKSDLAESCDKPIVCVECEERLRNDRVSTQTIKTVQKEILRIRKELYFRALDFVKAKPIAALLVSSTFAVALGVVGSIIASYVYDSLK